MKIPATPEMIKTFWRMQVLIFISMINLNIPKRESLTPHNLKMTWYLSCKIFPHKI